MRAIVLALVLAGLPGAGHATTFDAETCQGQPATIVATDGLVEGTEGADVIVTGGNVSVLAKGGDDLICVSGRMPVDIGGGGPSVDGGAGVDSVEVRGSDSNDYVELYWLEQLDVRMAGAFDNVRLHGVVGTGIIDGGPGEGVIAAYDYMYVVLDLEDQVLVNGGTGRFTVTRMLNARAIARSVDLTGDSDGNKLWARGCRLTLRGGAATDILDAGANRNLTCTPRGAMLLGLKGDDRLYGTSRDDVLLGGPGRDNAVGNAGSDRCVAEKQKECER